MSSSFVLMFALAVFAGMAQGQTYTTIANGNWTAATTWDAAGIPPTASDIPAGAVINIRHTVAYNTGNNIKLFGEMRIQPIAGTTATLNVPAAITFETFSTGRFILINGIYKQCRFQAPACNDGQPYSGNNPGSPIQSGNFKNIGGYQEVRNSTVEIAQDWTSESGGDRIIEDSCVKTGQNFSMTGTGSTDIIRRSFVSIGWHNSGNFEVAVGTVTYDQLRVQVAGTGGSFKLNSGTVSGDIDFIALRNHIIPNTGTGDLSASTSVVGTVNLDQYCVFEPSKYIPNGRFTGTQTANQCNQNFSCLGPTFVNVSGTVFNDVNGLQPPDLTVNGVGIGTPSGTPLYANLISGTTVVATVPINADGTYLHTGVAPGTYTVQVSTVQGVVGSPTPATTLPAGWVNTGENLGTAAGNDGTVNGLLPITVGTTNVINANFGIEQRPVPNDTISPSQQNPGGTTNVTVPATAFNVTDPDGGITTSIRITAFPSNATTITINGVTFTSTSFPAGGVIVPTNAAGNPTQPITVDPIDGSVTVGIPYRATDNAGVESTVTATASLPFTLSLSGNVFNDVNGLTDGTVNGAGIGMPSGVQLHANLLDNLGNVIATVPVGAGGTYSFTGLNSGAYTVQVTTNMGTIGNPAPVNALPPNWVNTGQNLGAGIGSDGAPNDHRLSVTVGSTNVTNANFGIEQRPTPIGSTQPTQNNPGGTTNVTVPSTAFSGTDPDGGIITSIRITALPTGATTITINGTIYGPGHTPFPAGGVTVPTNAAGNPTQPILVDPMDGVVAVDIPFRATDNAGFESLTSAVARLPFIVSAASVEISGRVFDDNGRGIGRVTVSLIDSQGNVRTAITSPFGYYRFSEVESGQTYVVGARHKLFAYQSRLISVTDDVSDVDFVPASNEK